jgi:manganese-dependent ADP-ribose/CDP-alcohol diphosphatase
VGHELTLDNGGLDPVFTAMCQTYNPNDILKGVNYFEGLEGEICRWSPFNGGLGESQLKWLADVLELAASSSEKVIVFSHVILHPRATPKGNCHTLLWDYDKVLELFKRYGCVKLVIAGHAHHEGYFHCPETGIHHVSLESPLEAPDDQVERTYATLVIDDDTATIEGKGWVKSRTLKLR